MKKNLSNEELHELIRQAKLGQNDAFAELYSRFFPMIRSVCSDFPVGNSDEEQDLWQEASLAFFRALRDFRNDADSAAFAPYAKLCMTHRLIDWKRKTDPSRNALPIDGEADDTPDETQDPARNLLERERYLALCDKIRSLLSEEENRVWLLHFAGYDAAKIAEILGKNKKSVENALFRVRRKLRNGMESL